MKKILRIVRAFLVLIFGKPIVKPIYAMLAGVAGFFVFIKIMIAIIPRISDVAISDVLTGPIFWQIYVAFLLMVSHAQPDQPKQDQSGARYWITLSVETLATGLSLAFVGILILYSAALFPFTFWGLSVMVFMIMLRRVLIDSILPSIQILRFVSACWFLLVGAWMYLLGNEMNTEIIAFSLLLLFFYFISVVRRALTADASADA